MQPIPGTYARYNAGNAPGVTYQLGKQASQQPWGAYYGSPWVAPRRLNTGTQNINDAGGIQVPAAYASRDPGVQQQGYGASSFFNQQANPSNLTSFLARAIYGV